MDVLIPAALPDVINERNVKTVRAKIIVEGANIPMRHDIEEQLSSRDVLIVPDIVANAGGVISSYAEYKGYTAKKMFALVEEKISASTRAVLAEVRATKQNPRAIAMKLALQRLTPGAKRKK